MIDEILAGVKKIIPKNVFTAFQPAYHFLLGWLAAVWYFWPSEKMIVIGITGTTGKTTTSYLLENILNSAGLKTGSISTAIFSDGERTWMNDQKMTMLGRFFTQRMLKKMHGNGCQVAIVETTSQGILQYRHRFINYDTLVFTGLYPEHIEAHGGFENYKKAKGKLFAHLQNCRKKTLNGKEIKKTIIANVDDENSGYFLDFWAQKKMTFGIENSSANLLAKDISSDARGLSFVIGDKKIKTSLLGDFNVYNILAATGAALTVGVSWEEIQAGLEKIGGIPGRLEKIDEGQNFTVIVDYAFEPNAVAKLYETVKKIPHQKVIHVLGSTGGGRDVARRPKLGQLAGENADFVIVTNEDPYDEDPTQIIDEVAVGAKNKKEGENLWKIIDRREAIQKALALAKENDVVLITGKGNEQAICVADGKKIPWDDRRMAREILSERK